MSKTKVKSNRGGARVGAGRKAKENKVTMKAIAVYTQDYLDFVAITEKENKPKALVFSQLLASYKQ